MAANPPTEDFGQYLTLHKKELAPFFSADGSELFARIVPFVLAVAVEILVLSYVVGWAVDILLSRGFAALFAPTFSHFDRAFVFATGRVLIGILSIFIFAPIMIFVSGSTNFEQYLIGSVVVLILIGIAAQLVWIWYLYRSDFKLVLLFYLTLIVVHGFITMAIASPLIEAPASRTAQNFVDRAITPTVEAAAAGTKSEISAYAPAHAASAKAAAVLTDQIDQSKDEQVEVQKQIDEAKNSQVYLFSQIVKVHAQGDLKAARDQLAALLAKYPNGPVAALARGQLTQVTSELSAQIIEQQREQAEAARVAAQARADLLARANRGEVTLSEMRHVLLGKSRDEVKALFGPPTETASDRWGFAKQMIVNPITEEKTGLAVYFSEGTVQGVDYYNGSQ